MKKRREKKTVEEIAVVGLAPINTRECQRCHKTHTVLTVVINNQQLFFCPDCLKWMQKNWKYFKKEQKEKQEKEKSICRQAWIDYLIKKYGDIPVCEICGKVCAWSSGSAQQTVALDHRYEGREEIKETPSAWMAGHACSEQSKKLFDSCNFGLLCSTCNLRLPTKDRAQWLKKVADYIYKGIKEG